MKTYNKGLCAITILALILGWVLAGWLYYYPPQKPTANTNNTKIEQAPIANNQVIIVSKVALTIPEMEQVTKSVDGFMNEYKLPKGLQNIYTLSIEKRLNDALAITVNPGQKGDLGNITLYARKTNSVWAVDPNAGPWCANLKEFEANNCN